MNLPNLLTLSRVPILFVIVAFLPAEWPGAATLALVFFIVAGITDWLDGALARKWGLVSDFGKLMDALTDKILVVGLMVAVVVYGLVPTIAVFLVLLVLSREFLITGMRMMAASRGIVISAERAGKQKTVTQIIAIGLLLAVPAVRNDLGGIAGDGGFLDNAAQFIYWVGLFFLVLATLTTVTSGLRYFRKYWPRISEKQEAANS